MAQNLYIAPMRDPWTVSGERALLSGPELPWERIGRPWMVYHSAKARGSGWYRQISAQRFRWRADGTPDFGEPVPPGTPVQEPSGTFGRGRGR